MATTTRSVSETVTHDPTPLPCRRCDACEGLEPIDTVTMGRVMTDCRVPRSVDALVDADGVTRLRPYAEPVPTVPLTLFGPFKLAIIQGGRQ